MKPLIGISSLHYQWSNLEEAFKKCVNEYRFGLIEFSYHPNAIVDKDLSTIKMLSQKYQIKVGVHAWDNLPELGEDNGLKRMHKLLEVCLQMGAFYIVLHLGNYPDKKKGLEIISKILSKTIINYERSGITICLENHYAYEYKGMNELGGEPEDFLFIFRNINSPALKFCLDYGHSNLTKNTLSFIKKLHPWLASTHINDNFGLQDDHLGYGEGTVLWNKVLSATLSTGFLGPFVIEFPEKSGKFQIFSSELRELFAKASK